MTGRRLLALAAALAVLLGVSRWLQHREQAAPPSVPPVVLVPSTLAVEGLTALELSTGKTETPQVRLVHAPGQPWQVATLYQVPADPERVGRVVDGLRGLTGEVRATGQRWFPEFRVEEEKALRLVLRQGDLVVCDLLINRSPKASWVSFVRRRAGDVVCAVEDNLLGKVADVWGEVSAEALVSTPWADLRVFAVDPSAIEGVEVAERVRDAWLVRGERHAPFDSDAQRVVGTVVGWRAGAVVDPATQTDAFKAPRWRWLVTERGGGRWDVEEAAAPPKPAKDASGPAPTVALRRLPSGPYLTMEYGSLQSLREQLLPSAGQKKPTATPAKPKKS